MKDGTDIAGGTLAIGAANGIGTVDVETASRAVRRRRRGDGVSEPRTPSRVGQTTTYSLLFKNGTAITGGTVALGSHGRHRVGSMWKAPPGRPCTASP